MVRHVRADESPHVEYLRTALTEVRSRTLRVADGSECRGFWKFRVRRCRILEPSVRGRWNSLLPALLLGGVRSPCNDIRAAGG